MNEIMIAVIGAFGVIIGAVLSYHFTIRQQVKEQQRQYYIQYIESIMNLHRNINDFNTKVAYEKARVDLLMLGSPKLISKMNEYEKKLIGVHDTLTPIDKAEFEIILQARKDLRLNNRKFPEDLYLFTIK